jgi:hypothetical protein
VTKKSRGFDQRQKKQLLEHARIVIVEFIRGAIPANEPNRFEFGEHGFSIFGRYTVRFTEGYLNSRHEFTKLATKMLKAKNAHEGTIRALCQKAGQQYIIKIDNNEHQNNKGLNIIASELVETVLAEADKEYIQIVPNYLIKHGVPEVISIGRVQSFPTEIAGSYLKLLSNKRIRLTAGDNPNVQFVNGGATLSMPRSIWVVDVPATKENVEEEGKWLIDVAVSLIRLSTLKRPTLWPQTGEIEAHPTDPKLRFRPSIVAEGETLSIGGGKLQGIYEIDASIVADLALPRFKSISEYIFDPIDKSLAQRVAQGLGWMTRGRQVADRAERLIFFFTSLEALLSTGGKNDPVTQTLSRYASVIYAQDAKSRHNIFGHIRSLYDLRSVVIHAGRREVLWQEVNNIQHIVEAIFWIVLNRCDLGMQQERFIKSLSDASHGMRWEFAGPAEQATADLYAIAIFFYVNPPPSPQTPPPPPAPPRCGSAGCTSPCGRSATAIPF